MCLSGGVQEIMGAGDGSKHLSSCLAKQLAPEVGEEGVGEGGWEALLDLADLGGIGNVSAAEVEDASDVGAFARTRGNCRTLASAPTVDAGQVLGDGVGAVVELGQALQVGEVALHTQGVDLEDHGLGERLLGVFGLHKGPHGIADGLALGGSGLVCVRRLGGERGGRPKDDQGQTEEERLDGWAWIHFSLLNQRMSFR